MRIDPQPRGNGAVVVVSCCHELSGIDSLSHYFRRSILDRSQCMLVRRYDGCCVVCMEGGMKDATWVVSNSRESISFCDD